MTNVVLAPPTDPPKTLDGSRGWGIFQGRQTHGYAGSGARSNATAIEVNTTAWFKERAMLDEALESSVALDEEQMAFLEDNGDIVTIGQQSQEIPTPLAF
ncbi:hypothetical protein Tco_1224657 [Tanacetum coccineum]